MIQSEGQYKGALYLDVDGVIVADEVPFADARELYLGSKVSDTVARGLGSTGLELLWLTSWEDDILEMAEDDFDPSLHGGKAFSRTREDRMDGLSWIEWKLVSILRDQQANSRPFVWVDDSITDDIRGRVLRDTDAPSLIVVPERRTGINPDDLAQIQAFAQSLE
jgi:hypothetical protein